jgi:hypothetical protein
MSIDRFMGIIRKIESGGNYSVVNSIGCRGAYQFCGNNFSAWAGQILGNPNAPMTPANQDAVARGKMLEYYKRFGSWEKVALAWHSGPGAAAGQVAIGPNGRNYVSKFRSLAGSSFTEAPSYGGGGLPGAGYGGGGGGGALYAPRLAAAPQPAAPGATPPGEPTPEKPLLQVTGYEGARITTRPVGFPVGLDVAAFENFYRGFRGAYLAGQSTWTDWSSGRPVSYAVPEDPSERIKMMGFLDGLRIDAAGVRMTQGYDSTEGQYAAQANYATAIQDAAQNSYSILTMRNRERTGMGAYKPQAAPDRLRRTPPARQPVRRMDEDPNAIANGLAVIDQTRLFLKNSQDRAQAAFERGDVDMAWNLLRIAREAIDANAAMVQAYTLQARQLAGAIQGASGELMPEKVEEAMTKLEAFPDELKADAEAMDQLSLEIQKVTKQGADGQPLRQPGYGPGRGPLQIKDGYKKVLEPSGKVSWQYFAAQDYTGGTLNRETPEFVNITVYTGGRFQEVAVRWHPGVVGEVGGQPIMGKVVSGQLPDGREYMLVENPFNLGHWSRAPLKISVPSGFTPVPGDPDPSVVAYQFTVDAGSLAGANRYGQRTETAGLAGTYQLQFDAKTGEYRLIKLGQGLFDAGTQTDLGSGREGNLPAQLVLRAAGFGVDTSGMGGEDRFWSDSPPIAGAYRRAWEHYLDAQRSPFERAPSLARTSFIPDRDDWYRPRVSATEVYVGNRDDWFRDVSRPMLTERQRQARFREPSLGRGAPRREGPPEYEVPVRRQPAIAPTLTLRQRETRFGERDWQAQREQQRRAQEAQLAGDLARRQAAAAASRRRAEQEAARSEARRQAQTAAQQRAREAAAREAARAKAAAQRERDYERRRTSTTPYRAPIVKKPPAPTTRIGGR